MPYPAPHSALVWFRRDLRHFDHAALYEALKTHTRVCCAFVFDTTILDPLPRQDRRLAFIRESLVELDDALRRHGGALIIRHGDARKEIPELAQALGATAVFTNHDYEPSAIARDAAVATRLQTAGITFHSFKDQVIFERDEVLTQAGKPFGVFTPYKNAWLRKLTESDFWLRSYPVEKYLHHLTGTEHAHGIPDLHTLGFEPVKLRLATGMAGGQTLFEDFLERIDQYRNMRDFPAVKGVSYLSTHLRFGTVSIRQLARAAWQRRDAGSETWLAELAWRDFYHQILYHDPDVVDHAWKREYDNITWESGAAADALFAAWCAGKTGYPIVDAAMRQLLDSGYMHNRLRMIVASFLTKDLGIHWLRGERFFAEHLLDYDLAANNGGWQWAASTGCDAQPYFRIFNPVSQSEKFDPQGKFIRRYLPELAHIPEKFIHAPWKMSDAEQAAAQCRIGVNYPAPIVDHAVARARTLQRFARGQ